MNEHDEIARLQRLLSDAIDRNAAIVGDVEASKRALVLLSDENYEQRKRAEAAEARVKELQGRMTEMVEAQLSRRVRAFHLKFGHPVRTTPCVPPDDEVRFRAKLILEEFLELLAAMFDLTNDLDGMRRSLSSHVDDGGWTVDVDLPEFVDACLDLVYVIEGAHAVFGVHAAPLAAEVHRANMEKDPTYVKEKDGFHKAPCINVKPTKPTDWKPPAIAEGLRAQGWVPDSECTRWP